MLHGPPSLLMHIDQTLLPPPPPQAFFSSPRGRWAMRFLALLGLLLIYLEEAGALFPTWRVYAMPDVSQAGTDASGDPTRNLSSAATEVAFAVFILGNIAETLQFLILRYKSNVLK